MVAVEYIANASPTAAPRSLEHTGQGQFCLQSIEIVDVVSLAHELRGSLPQNWQEVLGCPLATAQPTDGIELFCWRHQLWESHQPQLLYYSLVPSPRCNADRWGQRLHILRRNEHNVGSKPAYVAHRLEGSLHVVNQHHITISSPERGQKAEVGTQLSACVRSSEARHISGQRYIVFGVEEVKSHETLRS